MPSLQTVVCVVGPTAVGKTALSLDLAEALDAEVISADAMQVYRGMDIGTGKVLFEERRGIAHHMIDVADPTQSYTVHDYVQSAQAVLSDLAERGRMPVVVGGTGLYVRSLLEQFDFSNTAHNATLRADLTEQADKEGSQKLHEHLRALDDATAARIHPNDARRIIRALEIVMTTGQPVAQSRMVRPSPYRPVLIGLTADREALYRRIECRVDGMIRMGLIDEVRDLLTHGCRPTDTAMQAIGYKEIVNYLQGDCTRDDAIDAIKKASRRYAKRQWSWFRADARIVWYEGSEGGMMRDVVMPYIQRCLAMG